MTVAIDGPAGSGKSTIAQGVAERVGIPYVNSGNLYRAVTLLLLRRGVISSASDARGLSAWQVDPLLSPGVVKWTPEGIVLEGKTVAEELRSDQVDTVVPSVSGLPGVRGYVNQILREAAAEYDVVVEGRDIGSIVFPDAEVKVFLDASVEARAQRRYQQGTSRLSLEEIRESIAERDRIDRAKPGGALTCPEDALRIDTSHLTIDEVCDKVTANIHGHFKTSELTRRQDQ